MCTETECVPETVGDIRRREDMLEETELFSDYYDIRELFKHFFRCSLLHTWDNFDFDEAFMVTIPYIEAKLSLHGLTTFDEYLEQFIELCDTKKLEEFTVNTCYIYISLDDVIEAVAKLHYEKSRDGFGGYGAFDELKRIISEYDDGAYKPLPELISLFDSVIHAEHVNGDIFEDELYPDDPDTLRDEVEAELHPVS